MFWRDAGDGMLPRRGIEWGSLLTIRNGVVLVLDAPISAMRGKEGKNKYKLFFFFSVVSHCFIITIIIIIIIIIMIIVLF